MSISCMAGMSTEEQHVTGWKITQIITTETLHIFLKVKKRVQPFLKRPFSTKKTRKKQTFPIYIPFFWPKTGPYFFLAVSTTLPPNPTHSTHPTQLYPKDPPPRLMHMADLEAQEFDPTLATDPSLWPQIVVGPRSSPNKKKLGKNGDGSCSPGIPKAWENWIFCRDDLRDDLRDYWGIIYWYCFFK